MTGSSEHEIIYFAYGSNMSSAQMQDRCPSAVKIGIALLRDKKLVFPRHSQKRNCAVSGIEEALGDEVWGVIWKMSGQDRTALDKSEGYRPERQIHMNSYNPIDVTVIFGDGTPVSCFTYEAIRQKEYSGKPSRDYLATILEGAREHGLPAHYVTRLKHIKCQD